VAINLNPEGILTMTKNLGGQLWQECERCGNEPSYLPYELCEDCFPEAKAQSASDKRANKALSQGYIISDIDDGHEPDC
jgi:hypothetical protein